MTKQFVKELKDKDQIHSVFLASDKMVMNDKNGKPYMSLNLSDISGSINGRLWDKVEDVDGLFSSGDFVFVKGHVQLYQNRVQVVLHDIKPVAEQDFDLKDFLPTAVKPADEMLQELTELVRSLDNAHIRDLILSVFQDENILPLLKRSPAAKTIHHAYVGGLLEHILSICNIMQFLSSHYPFLNRDYLLFGAIFHDIGKVWELTLNPTISYSDEGRLLGHMQLACELIDEKSRKILGFPEKLRHELKHIVLSHHGRLEYGSPKRPKFLEAMIVAMVDELDSKVNSMVDFMNKEMSAQENWTRFNPMFDRYLYLDILRNRLGDNKTS